MPQHSKLSGLTYTVRTFGCQMNLHDSERVSGLLDDLGMFQVETPTEADLVVYMTCSVREKADTHLFGEVSNLVRLPDPPSGRRLVAIGGCIGQRDGADLKKKIPNVDVVFGTSAISELPRLLFAALDQEEGEVQVDTVEDGRDFSTALPSKREEQFRAWVPIMTGCNNFCTYCIVPYVRGREKSRVFERIVAEVEKLVADGVREVTLLGQNVNSYGRDLYGEPRFAELLRAVGETGIERIRFTSSNPKDLSEATIQAMAEVPAVMPHLHLAVQSGSTEILRKMNRSYTREEYLDVVAQLKAAIPDIALTTDIIVGFPGETEADLNDTCTLVEEAAYASAFTFIYSPRPGTPAAKMQDDTPHEVIQERFDKLAGYVERSAYAHNQRYADRVLPVLVEAPSKKNKQVLMGRSPYNTNVLFDLPEGKNAADYIGKIVDVKIELCKTWYLKGFVQGEPR